MFDLPVSMCFLFSVVWRESGEAQRYIGELQCTHESQFPLFYVGCRSQIQASLQTCVAEPYFLFFLFFFFLRPCHEA